MTLENLLAIHRLQAFEATSSGVLRLLASAERNLADAILAHTWQWLKIHRPDLFTENH